MADTTTTLRRRWFQFTSCQIAYATVWIAVAVALYLDRSQRWEFDGWYMLEWMAIWATFSGGIGVLFRRPLTFAALGALIGFLVTPQPFVE